MNILVGSHGTGKTTLLKEINRTRPEIYTSDGFSRVVQKFDMFNNAVQQDLMNALTTWRWREDLLKKNCFFARSIIDSIVYTKVLYNTTSGNDEFLLQETMELVENYFYLPIEFDLKGDDSRPSSVDFQKQIDSELLLLLDTYAIPFITLSGTVQQRLETINRYIK